MSNEDDKKRKSKTRPFEADLEALKKNIIFPEDTRSEMDDRINREREKLELFAKLDLCNKCINIDICNAFSNISVMDKSGIEGIIVKCRFYRGVSSEGD